MSKTNILGTFIRNRRKEKGYSDVTSFARSLSRSISYVSRVEVGTSDGPSLKLLQEIALALDVDFKRLVQMREQDDAHNRPEDARDRPALAVEQSYAYGQSDLMGNAGLETAVQYAVAVRDQSEGPKGIAAEEGNTEDVSPGGDFSAHYSNVQMALKAQAQAHLDIAEKLHEQHLWKEAQAELSQSLTIYERLNNSAGTAFACFSLGRLHRRMVQALLLSPAERLGQMMLAGNYFERAYHLFRQALSNESPEKLPEEYRDRLPECLTQWGRIDEEIATQLDRSGDGKDSDYHDNYFDDAAVMEKREELKQAAQQFYRSRAYSKRKTAIVQYQARIDELFSRSEAFGSSRKDYLNRQQEQNRQEFQQDNDASLNYSREKDVRLLAGTYHRLGVLYRDIACSKSEAIDHLDFGKKGIAALKTSMHYRREIATRSQGIPKASEDSEEQEKLAAAVEHKVATQYIDRLANSHADLGLSLLLLLGLHPENEATVREEAYWQFRVAKRLYALLGLNGADPRMEYVDIHIIDIQKGQGLESDIIARQNIEKRLEAVNFGTIERPNYQYPLMYHLASDHSASHHSDDILNLQT